MLFFGPRRSTRNITPLATCDDCGIRVRVASNTCCTQVCSRVAYEITLTNNCDVVTRRTVLQINIPSQLCIDASTITVDGTPNPDLNLTCIELGTLEVGQTVTINYQATVMECQRYVKTSASVAAVICCCCQASPLAYTSNTNVVQVCCCCCNNANSAS